MKFKVGDFITSKFNKTDKEKDLYVCKIVEIKNNKYRLLFDDSSGDFKPKEEVETDYFLHKEYVWKNELKEIITGKKFKFPITKYYED